MELTITWTGGSLTINVEDNSYHYEQVMGDNNLHLTFKTSEYVEIPLGAVVAFQNVSYKLCVPATIKKQSSTSFEIEAVFESPQYALKKYTMREYRYNENSGQWENSTPSLQFSLTATPLEHLKMIRDNLNRREGDNTWSIGSCITDKEKTLTFDYTNVWDALNNLATEFNTEWRIAGTVLYLGKVEFNKTQPLELSYGKGNGFKSGVGRTNYGDTMPIEVLNVQGTDRNIDPRPFSQGGYGSKRLRLPGQQAFLYEDGGAFSWNGGTTWEKYDEENNVWETLSGYTPTNAQSYATDNNGDEVHISANQQKTHQEANFDGTEIYPCRYGVLSDVVPEQGSGGQTLYNVFDSSIPSNLNYNDCQIPGEEKMKIVFQSGMLAGREFEIAKYIHATREFQLINEEIDGIIMPEPSAYFPRPKHGEPGDADYYEGDRYAIFGIQLPQAYIADFETHTGASFDMLRAAVKYLHENKNAKYTFSGELDGIFAKNQWATLGGRLRIGEYVSFTDSNFQSTSVLIRIIGVKQYINNPYSPEIEMSNDSIGSTLISEVRKAQAQEVTTEILNRETIRYAKRRFTDAKQTSEALEKMIEEVGSDFSNFSGGISPITVQTMQLLVGSENLQFAFGSIASGVFTKRTISATFGSNKIFTIGLSSGQYLMHYTIGQPKTMTTAASTATMKVWKMPVTNTIGPLSGDLANKTYYIYAKVKKSDAGTVGSVPSSTANNSFVHSETAIAMDDGQASGYYYFLVGILNAEIEEDRSFAEMFGYSEILPNRITTDKIMSSDGQGVVIDLVNGSIKGNITFEAGTTSYNALQGIISGNSTVQTAATTANRAEGKIDGLEIGGRNLLPIKDVTNRTAGGLTSTKGADGWIAIDGIVTATSDTALALFGAYIESTSPSKGGDYYLSVEAEGLNFTNLVCPRYYWREIGETSGNNYVNTPQSQQIDLDGKWLRSIGIYINKNARDTEWHGRIRLKLEKGNVPTAWTPAPEDVSAEIGEEAAAQTAALTNLAASVASDIEALQDQIDGKVETWFGDTEPTMNNEPARTWIAEGKESDHLGDMYYDNITGYAYRFANTGTTASPVYAWLDVSDSAVVEALTLAREAKTAADGKMQVFVAQPVPPYEEGDMWVQGANGDIKYCATARESGAFVASDWVIASKYTDDTAANAAQSAADAAQTTAENAETHAQSALTDLTNYASDAKISPTEKQALVQQLSDINAEYAEIVKQATLYSLLTNSKYTEYVTAYTNAKTSLEYYTDSTTWANHITIITGNVQYSYGYIETYYGKRQAILDKIAETAQDYADNAAQTAVNNLQIGGRNLLTMASAQISTSGSNGIVSEKRADGWIHLSGTFARGSYAETRPIFGGFTEENTPAKDGVYTLSVQCDNVTLDNEFSVVLGSYALGATSSRQDVFITATNGSKVVDLTGRWVYRVLMYGTTNADGRVFNGNIRFKLEKGNKATDWTPAPEDTEAELTALHSDLQGQIDSKIETWSQSADPSTNWTAAEKTAHEGDLWQYTGTTTQTRTHNATYRWSGSAWVEQQASSELFDKIDGKAAIFYGSPDTARTGVSIGDYLVDNSNGKSYRWVGDQQGDTGYNNGWVNVQDYQTAIATLNTSLTTKIDNITDDSIISKGTEKYTLKREWEEIRKSEGGTPETFTGSYPTVVARYNALPNKTAELQTMYNAFTNSQTSPYALLAAKMNVILDNMNDDTPLSFFGGGFDSDDFRALWTNYYESERELNAAIDEFVEDRIRKNLQAKCATAEGTALKVIECDEWKDSYFKEGTRLTIICETGSTCAVPTMKFYGNDIPSGDTGIYFYYRGQYSAGALSAVQSPRWLAQMSMTLVYKEHVTNQTVGQSQIITGHVFEFEDESAFEGALIFGKSIQGQTDIFGGCVLTETMVLRDEKNRERAGMSGIGGVALWGGGTLAQAIAELANVFIMHSGRARFGNLRISEDGIITMPDEDSPNVSRLMIMKESMPAEQDSSALVTKTTANATPQYPANGYKDIGTYTNSQPVEGAFTFNDNVTDSNGVTNISGIHTGMIVRVYGSCTISAVGLVSGTTINVYLKAGRNLTLLKACNLSTTQQSVTLDIDASSPVDGIFSAKGTNTIGLQFATSGGGSRGVSMTVASNQTGLKIQWYHDASGAKTIIASDGFGVQVNTTNLFKSVQTAAGVLTTTIKGNTDIPGVLWAGKITNNGGVDTYYKNSAKYGNNLTCSYSNKVYTITHRLGTNNFAAQITPYTSGVTYSISKTNNSTLTITLSSASNFDLVLFGTN